MFSKSVIDFGKYNRTIYSIICYTYLYSQIRQSENKEQITSIKNLDDLSNLAKIYMPFLYDKKLFDPIQAAWSILYDAATLSDFDPIYHEHIQEFIKIFSERLNELSYDTVMKFIKKSEKPTLKENINFVYRLNANSFAYQQLIFQFITDVKQLFGIDIKDYFPTYENYVKELWNYKSYGNNKTADGFYYLCNDFQANSLLAVIDFDSYIKDIINSIFAFGKKIRILREDLRLMTLRNSYKGTTALIQFAVIEYLRDCILDLTEKAKDKYNFENGEHVEITKDVFDNIIKALEDKTQKDIIVSEYWDYTE